MCVYVCMYVCMYMWVYVGMCVCTSIYQFSESNHPFYFFIHVCITAEREERRRQKEGQSISAASRQKVSLYWHGFLKMFFMKTMNIVVCYDCRGRIIE